MTAREFLSKIIEECPSRGLDDVEIRIDSEVYENLFIDSYDVVNISNEGSNDGIFITIKDYSTSNRIYQYKDIIQYLIDVLNDEHYGVGNFYKKVIQERWNINL